MNHNDSIDHMLENFRPGVGDRGHRDVSPGAYTQSHKTSHSMGIDNDTRSRHSKYSEGQWNRMRFLFNKPYDETYQEPSQDPNLNNPITKNNVKPINPKKIILTIGKDAIPQRQIQQDWILDQRRLAQEHHHSRIR